MTSHQSHQKHTFLLCHYHAPLKRIQRHFLKCLSYRVNSEYTDWSTIYVELLHTRHLKLLSHRTDVHNTNVVINSSGVQLTALNTASRALKHQVLNVPQRENYADRELQNLQLINRKLQDDMMKIS